MLLRHGYAEALWALPRRPALAVPPTTRPAAVSAVPGAPYFDPSCVPPPGEYAGTACMRLGGCMLDRVCSVYARCRTQEDALYRGDDERIPDAQDRP